MPNRATPAIKAVGGVGLCLASSIMVAFLLPFPVMRRHGELAPITVDPFHELIFKRFARVSPWLVDPDLTTTMPPSGTSAIPSINLL